MDVFIKRGLLKEFKSVKKVVNAEVDDLKKVEKVGDKKAEEIKRVVDEEYSD